MHGPQIIITSPLCFINYLKINHFYLNIAWTVILTHNNSKCWPNFGLQYTFINTWFMCYFDLKVWFWCHFMCLNYNKMHLFIFMASHTSSVLHTHYVKRISNFSNLLSLKHCNSTNTINRFNHFFNKKQYNIVDTIGKLNHFPETD